MTSRPESERRTILVTGGTGALGVELVSRLTRTSNTSVVVLARGTARARTVVLPPGVRTLTGDVRLGPTFGLGSADVATLRERVTDIVHCAADTTFNRPLADARATNVAGTQAVLGFAKECRHLQRMVCFSTVYVAGRTTGAHVLRASLSRIAIRSSITSESRRRSQPVISAMRPRRWCAVLTWMSSSSAAALALRSAAA